MTSLLLYTILKYNIFFCNKIFVKSELKIASYICSTGSSITSIKDIFFLLHSDAIRLVLIQKYGGWYADLDIVFLKSLHTFEEGVLGCDNVPAETKELVNLNYFFFREINRNT